MKYLGFSQKQIYNEWFSIPQVTTHVINKNRNFHNIIKWCDEQPSCGGFSHCRTIQGTGIGLVSLQNWYFELESDALMFTLMWG